jgi:hypothetical protein
MQLVLLEANKSEIFGASIGGAADLGVSTTTRFEARRMRDL